MTVLSIPDMTCGHCRSSVTAALTAIAPTVEIDAEAREVRVPGVPPEPLIAALDKIGFPARVKSGD